MSTLELLEECYEMLSGDCHDNAVEALAEAQRCYSEAYKPHRIRATEKDLKKLEQLIEKLKISIADYEESETWDMKKHVFVNDWANWVAVDSWGEVWEYENKPIKYPDCWDGSIGMTERITHPIIGWEDSLTKRK